MISGGVNITSSIIGIIWRSVNISYSIVGIVWRSRHINSSIIGTVSRSVRIDSSIVSIVWISHNISSSQGCQISWISQESPGFEIVLLGENLLISGADFLCFLLILILFPDYLSVSLLSTIWWNISWVNKKVYNNSTKITRGYRDLFFLDLFSNGIYLFVTDLFIVSRFRGTLSFVHWHIVICTLTLDFAFTHTRERW